MKLLTVADCHGNLTYDNLKEHTGLADGLAEEKIDTVVFLGDNSTNDIETVLKWLKESNMSARCIGILGNHDSPNVLTYSNIENLHLKKELVGEFVFLGFGGSVKYKEENNGVSFTQEESLELLADAGRCDIVIAHSNPQFWEYEQVPEPESFFDKLYRIIRGWKRKMITVQKPVKTDVHSGLIGLGTYIDTKRPRYFFCGHLHKRETEQRGDTTIFNCYGVQVISVDLY